jgi:hypothetical protein
MRFGLIAESLRTTADADENAGTGTAQASDKMLHLLQAQSAISLSLVRAQQADGDETYFIMKSSGIAILHKA